MNPGIFREYDIRGIAGKDLDEKDVKAIGRAAGTYLLRHGCRKIMVGRLLTCIHKNSLKDFF
jgi:phosphomannomutase/phosphoglucomutase